MWCLTRLIGIILGNYVETGNKLWALIQQVADVIDLVSSPKKTANSISDMETTIVDFLQAFKEVHPEHVFTPEMHFLLHYPSQTLQFGP